MKITSILPFNFVHLFEILISTVLLNVFNCKQNYFLNTTNPQDITFFYKFKERYCLTIRALKKVADQS